MNTKIFFSTKTVTIMAIGMIAAACTSLRPRDVNHKNTSDLKVAFDAGAVGSLAADMKQLQIRVFKMVNDDRTTIDTEDMKDIVPQQSEYEIKGVSLGKKEIEVAILDADEKVMGLGSVVHMVVPGANKTAPLVIKIKKIEVPTTSITVELEIKYSGDLSVVKAAELTWNAEKSGVSDTSTLALGAVSKDPSDEVLGTLKKRCAACHNDAFDQAGIELDMGSYPYTSDSYTADETLSVIFERMTDSNDPMPPNGVLPAAQLDPVLEWKKVLEADAPVHTVLEGLKIADKLTGEILLLGESGIELHKSEIEAYSIEENGTLKIVIDLKIENPTVAVPITVQQ